MAAGTGIVALPLELSRPELALGAALLEAYDRWGSRLTQHLIGQYCGVVVDTVRREVLLVQDSLGVRTLFYALEDDEVVFASHLGGLLLERQFRCLDRRYIAEVLTRGEFASSRTPYNGVRRLINGASLRFSASGVTTVHPWSPKCLPHRAVASEKDLTDVLMGHLRLSLEGLRRLQRVLWCDVSGGLDSGTVYAVAQEVGVPVEAFSVVSRVLADDGDTALLDKMFLGSKVKWHSFDVAEAAPFAVVPDIAAHEPGGEIGFALRRKLAALRREAGVDLGLSGMGGDQVFGAMDSSPRHLADDLRSGAIFGLWASLADWTERHAERRPRSFWLLHYAVSPVYRHWTRQRIADGGGCVVSWIDGRFMKEYGGGRRPGPISHWQHPKPGRHTLWEEIYVASAIEAATVSHAEPCPYYHPLLHRPLVEFMFSVPYRLRRQADRDRVLHRQAMSGLLAEEVRTRQSKGTGQASFDRSFAEATLWQNILARSRLAALGIVRPSEWQSALRRARFGLFEEMPVFCAAVCIETWLQSDVGLRLRCE